MEFYLAVVKCCEEDHLGSVTRIYDTSGTAVFSAEYDPWVCSDNSLTPSATTAASRCSPTLSFSISLRKRPVGSIT